MTDRKTLIKLIHIAKKKLVLDDSEYRAILEKVTSKNSCAKMTILELNRVLAHFRRCGWGVEPKPQTRALADDTQSKMIRALWLELARKGFIQDQSEAALGAFVKRCCGVEALQWTTPHQRSNIIEKLKKWLARKESQNETHTHRTRDNQRDASAAGN